MLTRLDTGATTAHNLLASPNRPSSIVVLEAREAASGASGRNAGHCRPDAYRGFNAYRKQHGEEEAAKILVSERISFEKQVITSLHTNLCNPPGSDADEMVMSVSMHLSRNIRLNANGLQERRLTCVSLLNLHNTQVKRMKSRTRLDSTSTTSTRNKATNRNE